MAVSKKLEFAKLDDLCLDPLNPRLGHHNANPNMPQNKILALMADWNLDELAVSFLESGGYWSQEAMIVIRQDLYGKSSLVVIEGNRRLAALMLLRKAVKGQTTDKKWKEIAASAKLPTKLFEEIPYFLADRREDIEGFLGFRHVTGIEEWRPAEKAEYIARLIDKGMSYQQVTRKIGSKVEAVRRNYIAYRLLLQMEINTEIPKDSFEDRFSVLFLSLRTEGVRKFLQIDIQADPVAVKRQLPKLHKKNLASFALWLFGDEKRTPLFTDSRQVDKFGRVLENKDAVEYLERSDSPSFEVALRTAGGDEPEIINLIEKASDNIELALGRAHHYKKSKKLQAAVVRLNEDTRRLAELFPEVNS